MDLNKILIWNCRGAASPDLFRNCKQFVDVHCPEVFAIIETRCNPLRTQNTFRRLGYDGFSFSENRGYAGGIAVGWKTDLVLMVEDRNDFQFLHFNVVMHDHRSWFFSIVYASPVEEMRAELWGTLATMANTMQGNWMLAGDFNDICDSNEKKGGAPLNVRKCQLFQNRIQQCGLMDLGSIGSKFTWKGQTYGTYDRMFARLDRGMCNASWRLAFPNAFVKVLTRVDFSDHHPILINLHGSDGGRETRPFRFESAWVTHSDFARMMKEAWHPNGGLEDKLVSMKDHLRGWSHNVFGSVKKKKRQLLARLDGIQRQTSLGNMNCFLSNLEKELQTELHNVLYQEELMWFQRSRTQWLHDGDRNTRYYQLKAVNRKKRNRILMLRNSERRWMENEAEIKDHVTNFFMELFTDNEATDSFPTMRYQFKALDDGVVRKLDAMVTDDEITQAIVSMKPWKAPGPDGFQAGFYQTNWELIRKDCCDFVKKAWSCPTSVAAVNDTDICLIPKIARPEFINQFRPISLCNVTYKIITKVIVNRLKPIMPSIISPYQTGFIPTRSIHENIVVAQELLHSMGKMRGKNGFFAIKVDLAKAYDKVRWSFINLVLSELGMPPSLRNLIMECVSTVNTNVLWNGRRSESFTPQRGIRQGDPMSPYLFVMCMDKLTHLIEEEVEASRWVPIRAGRSGPQVSHLMFADDLLLFGKATDATMTSVLNALNKFCGMSGQMVSQEKTSLFFSKNVDVVTRRRLERMSGFNTTQAMGKYLGIPLLGRAPKRQDFHYLIEKVNHKLSGWKATHLSFAGRVTLARSVIQAMPTYTMMTNPIPKVCLREIEKIQRSFIWGDSNEGRRLHMIKWDTLTLPKVNGGLGLRRLTDMNKACIMKLAWNLKAERNKLWSQVLIGKYGRNNWEQGEVQCKVTDSHLWRAIADCLEDIKSEGAWSIGDGTAVSFWFDKWLDSNQPLCELVTEVPASMHDWRVVDLVDEHNNWKLDVLHHILPGRMYNKLLSMPAPAPSMGSDLLFWPKERAGNFTVSSAYVYLRNATSLGNEVNWKTIWKLDVPERVRSFAWQIMHGKLPTRVYCSRWSGDTSGCYHCVGVDETIIHVLRDCPLAIAVWKLLVPQDMRSNFFGYDFEAWVRFNVGVMDGSGWRNVWATTCFFLWGWRNRTMHDPSFSRPAFPATVVQRYVHEYQVGKNQLNPAQGGVKETVLVSWKPAVDGWVTVNTDGASKAGGGISGCGGLVRDHHGRWLGGFTRFIGETHAYIAELWGALEGLLLAWTKGYRHVELQLDSKVVVSQLTGNGSGTMMGRGLVHRLQQMLQRQWQVKILHIYREANMVADGLACIACEGGEGMHFWEHPPERILQFLHDDCIGVSTPRLVSV